MQPHVVAERLFAVALDLFQQRGYASVTLADIAAAAQYTPEELYRHYPRKDSFILTLYERIASLLEERVGELPVGTMAQRYRAMLQTKLALLEPHREWLKYLQSAMLDPENRLGVLGRFTDRIRARTQGVFDVVVLGASDAPLLAEEALRIARFLYTAHLAVVFLTLQDQTEQRRLGREGLDLLADLGELGIRLLSRKQPSWTSRLACWLLGLPRPGALIERLDRVVGSFVQPPHDSARFGLAENLVRDLFRYRRLQPGSGRCADHPCPQCLALHLPRVGAFLEASQPVHLVLPAFPAKSANPHKVTGPLPDFGEELALLFLQQRCQAIRDRYPPGARLTICSDGRVFNDLVGVSDDAVTAYRQRLQEMIRTLGLDAIDVFDLDDVRPGEDFAATRRWLLEQYGEPLDALVERTRRHEPQQQLFNGIHRFLMEDLAQREPGLTRTQARNQSKDQAYEVVRRSNAWSRLVAAHFPGALRLSIHPQPPHSEKIGIVLTPADDPWLTPWHGVVLLRKDEFVLTRRAEAEAQGARLVCREGRPSHFELEESRREAARHSGARA